jgi:FkbM family methyltransferase
MRFNLKKRIGALFKEKKSTRLEREYAQKSYSQQGEDITIMRLLENKPKGFFVDIGAFHPIKYSNTYTFYKKGWRGINIEPNPDARQDFLKYRAHDINLNIAIGNSSERLSYYKFNVPAVNSFSLEHVDKWKQVPDFYVKEVLDIQTQRLQDVLKEHLPDHQIIDFMSIDVENFDLEVLKSNDWDLYRPFLLLVEEDILQLDSFTESPIVTYLQTKNYALISVCNGTLFFRDNY